MNNVIFDIGANNGVDGLGYALFNRDLNIYAFEANPYLIKKILINKQLIENFFNLKLNNYTIIDKAVSNYNGKDDFYVSEYDLCSSLLKYKFVKTEKKITCEVLTLKNFCDEKKIDNIIHLHSDTQGSDLNVLKGLDKYNAIVHSGVIETMIEKKDINYEGASSFKDFETFLKENNFEITKKVFNDYAHREINVFFKNVSKSLKLLAPS
jgi:FkbM family methyltransferase